MPHVLFASAESLDFGRILLDLAIVLVVAKAAAEIAERLRIPAVLGEIVVGIAIGPSALGLVDPSDSLKLLAELGVIVLLAQVGLEMDIVELRRVGRASLLVAVIGVVAPMSLGIAAGLVTGEEMNASLFLGAALAATSVGITARVFGDLRALNSTEARVVLGAAVADDVLGLIILTVVTRVVERGSIDLGGVASTLGLAIGFLAVASVIGLLVVPRLFQFAGPRARSSATIGVLAGALVFAFASAASSAKLAPIIGAFVAGIALGKVPQHDRVAREFSVLGNLLIPVFFLQIGIDTEISKFFQLHVLWLALLLTAIAILAKIVAAVGAFGTPSDKLLIGIGMIPRGEVGLIFATIGLQVGVFGDDLYAVVLLVVLLTTVVTPPLLRWRLGRARASSAPAPDATDEPAGGWLRVDDGEVVLVGVPPRDLILQLSCDASVLASQAKPGEALLEWEQAHNDSPLTWNDESTEAFLNVLHRGTPRSWRFLDLVGILDRALPELADAVKRRRVDASELDPTHSVLLPTVEAVRGGIARVARDNSSLILAAFVADLDSADVDGTPVLRRLSISEDTQKTVTALVSASTLLRAVISAEPYEAHPRVLAQLADYLGSPLNVELCRQLTEARGEISDWQYSVLLGITSGVQEVLAHPELIEGREGSVESMRRSAALALVTEPHIADRIRHASASYILAHEPETIARHATLVEPKLRRRTVRVSVTPHEQFGNWMIDIATSDMPGLLARISGVLADGGLDVVNADLTTWPDGAVLDSFTVSSQARPSARQLAFELERGLRGRLGSPRRLQVGLTHGLTIRFDHDAHPWHTVVTVTGADQPGLLQSLATAFARAGVNVHHAAISTEGGVVTDRFEVSDRHGRKIRDSVANKVESFLR